MDKKIGLSLGLAVSLTTNYAVSQNAFFLPLNQRVVGLTYGASPDESVAGYKIYYGPGSGAYTNFQTCGNVTSVLVTNLESNVKYYFAATAYNLLGEESVFSNELPLNTGPASTASVTNIFGVWYYEISQTRYTNDSVLRVLQSENASTWKTIPNYQKINEAEIDSGTYYTTWRIPSSKPPVLNMYFESRGIVEIENGTIQNPLSSPGGLRIVQ